MAPPFPLSRFLSAAALVLALAGCLSSPSVLAQDRSVPRFGPLVTPDTIQAAPSDVGRMWSFARPPLDYFETEYGIRADERGLEHARLGTVRLPGCSGAVVSPEGLVLTAARCVRPFFPASADDSLRKTAFYAESPSQERALPDLSAERLVEMEDVTTAVASADAAGAEQVQSRMQEEAPENHTVEVVSEAGGARFVAYTYRRIDDVRLVFAPDPMVTVLGRLGEPLTYPQYAWDVAALRLYEGDTPLDTPQHLEVTERGVRPGDAVFTLAHPDDTRRAETHQQLAFRRDVVLPARVAALEDWTRPLGEYVDTASTDGPWPDRLAEARAEHRQTRARLESLQSEYLMARLENRDQQLRQKMAANSGTGEKGDLLEQIDVLQSKKRTYADSYRAFWSVLHSEYTSASFRRAFLAHRMQESTSSASLEESLRAVEAQPLALDAAVLDAHLDRIRRHSATDTALVNTLQNLGPARSLLQTSVFSDAEQVRERMQEGRLPEEDPLLTLVAAIDRHVSEFETSWMDLAGREQRLTDSLSRARHQLSELPVTLPAERTLRMADGRITGYPYNGTQAPSFTTFYGLYGHHVALRAQDGEELPGPWQNPGASFDRSTPLTTVASVDLGGGAYGGPLLNSSLQVVGLVFDGNVQTAAGPYLFLPRRMRAVAVDVRGMIEGLTAIYAADGLVQEMTGGSPSQ